MKKILYLILAIMVTIWCCSGADKDDRDLSNKLQALVDGMIVIEGDDPIFNAVLLVDSPRLKWEGAAGKADGRAEVMTPDHKIKLASIGKTFTAAMVLQLMEEGVFGLDDPISRYLDDPAVRLDSLMIFDGKAYGRQITIRQLLGHRSGIADYMEDPRFIPDVLENPKKQYDAVQILNVYFDYQTNKEGLFPPGTGFNYSDVNYVLLAMLIERVTGESYHEQLKKRLFDPLRMDNSYLEHYENPRGDMPLSHAFFSTVDLITDVNTSFDWGGGGIVSTCEELNTFIRAMVDGKLFEKRSTLKQMLEAADEGLGGMEYDYGLGIMKRDMHGLTFYGHGGAYDCDAFYSPEEQLSICMSLNQMNTHGKRDEFLLKAIELILKSSP